MTAESKTRQALTKRLTDVVCLPSSEITPQERHMAGDVLFEMISEAEPALRLRVSRRLASLLDPPPKLLMLLSRDNFEIAQPLLEESRAYRDVDLAEIARAATSQHRLAIARRETVSGLVVKAIVFEDDSEAIRALLRNDGAEFTDRALNALVAASKDQPSLCPLLLRREELRPIHALTIFWWCGPYERAMILERFAVSRAILQEAISGVFQLADAENWSDGPSRKALQFIEPRQRSPYNSLEDAVSEAARRGLSRELTQEISHLAGVKPATGAQILTDMSGESIAVLCKATGLKRDSLSDLWRALRRESDDPAGEAFARVETTYDRLSVDKAQTVLRYWNWSLTSAMPANQAAAAGASDDALLLDRPESARTAALVFSGH